MEKWLLIHCKKIERSFHFFLVNIVCFTIISAEKKSFKVEGLRNEMEGWLEEERRLNILKNPHVFTFQ